MIFEYMDMADIRPATPLKVICQKHASRGSLEGAYSLQLRPAFQTYPVSLNRAYFPVHRFRSV